MKKILTLLAFALTVGCAGKHYNYNEGPFRVKFAAPYSIQHVHQVWTMTIFINGEARITPVHVEGYLDNNGTEYYQHHSDMPDLRRRTIEARNIFTPSQYCEAIGRPMDRFDADAAFWNRGQNQGDMMADSMRPVPNDAFDGEVVIRFKFFDFYQDGQEQWVQGKLLAEAKTKVKLECPSCRCGGRLR